MTEPYILFFNVFLLNQKDKNLKKLVYQILGVIKKLYQQMSQLNTQPLFELVALHHCTCSSYFVVTISVESSYSPPIYCTNMSTSH